MTKLANAPIALFVYARPSHTRTTLESLSQNKLADKSKLYIFADGPLRTASPKTHQAISEVRQILRERSWCGEVEIIESGKNRGLADSIVRGVTLICEKHGRVIVLEDDLETSPGFLRYMNDALQLYEDDGQVMQVSGFNVRNWPWAAESGFLRCSTSWGWATWQRAWQAYENDSEKLLSAVTAKDARAFELDGYSFHMDELRRNVSGDLLTWAVKWYASVFLRDGLCLYPRKTLVRNIGFDGSGQNCFDDTENFHRNLRLAKRIRVSQQPIKENAVYLHAMQRHFQSLLQQWTGTRLRDRAAKKLRAIAGK